MTGWPFSKGIHAIGLDATADDLNAIFARWLEWHRPTYIGLQGAVLRHFNWSPPSEIAACRLADRMLQKLKADGVVTYAGGRGKLWTIRKNTPPSP